MGSLIQKIDKALESKSSLSSVIVGQGYTPPAIFAEYGKTFSDIIHQRVDVNSCVEIDDSIETSIPDNFFENTTKLRNVTYSKAKTIGNRAFANSSVRRAILNEVRYKSGFGNDAFCSCDNITYIKISFDDTTDNKQAFVRQLGIDGDYKPITVIDCYNTNPAEKKKFELVIPKHAVDNETVIIPDHYYSLERFSSGDPQTIKLSSVSMANAKEIGSHAFYRHEKLDTAIFPNAVVVGDHAFNNCYCLKNIDFPKLEIIEKDGFNDCQQFIDITFPKVKIVGKDAFQNCYYLKYLTLPSIVSIDQGAFRHCGELLEIKAPNLTMAELGQMPVQPKDWGTPSKNCKVKCSDGDVVVPPYEGKN